MHAQKNKMNFGTLWFDVFAWLGVIKYLKSVAVELKEGCTLHTVLFLYIGFRKAVINMSVWRPRST